MLFRYAYKTPLGVKFEEIEAASREEADSAFWSQHHRDLCEILVVSYEFSAAEAGRTEWEPEPCCSDIEDDAPRGASPFRIRHLITRYAEGGSAWAEAWIQVDLFGRSWCLSRRRVRIDGYLSETGVQR